MCGRSLRLAAVVVPTAKGPLGYGPVCAKRAGLGAKHRQPSAKVCMPARQVDTLTPDLFAEVAA